jgi:hypothetical protein
MVGIAGILLAALASYIFNSVNDAKTFRRQLKLQRLDSQIEKLYGPLAGLLAKSQAIYEVALSVLPRDKQGRAVDFASFGNDPKNEVIWRVIVEQYFLPINDSMAQLIQTNIHLVDQVRASGEPNPSELFFGFIEHAMNFRTLHLLWKEKGIDTSASAKHVAFPEPFAIHVKNVLRQLQDRRVALETPSRLGPAAFPVASST